MKQVCLSLVVVAVMIFAQCALALTLYSGGNTFNLNVSNQQSQSLFGARGSVYISGNTANIEVSAEGYKTKRVRVYLREGTTYYSDWVRLDNPYIYYRLKDGNGSAIANSYVRDTYCMFADRFAFEVSLPLEGYSEFNSHDVSINASGSFVWGERIEVSTSGSTKKVKVILRRNSINGDFSNFIYITIPGDKNIKGYRKQLARKLIYVLHNDSDDKKLTKENKTALKSRINNLK